MDVDSYPRATAKVSLLERMESEWYAVSLQLMSNGQGQVTVGPVSCQIHRKSNVDAKRGINREDAVHLTLSCALLLSGRTAHLLLFGTCYDLRLRTWC